MIIFSGQNLSCIRGYTSVFLDLSFTVKSGEVLLLTGANGSGKTTLLRIISNLLPPYQGHIMGASPQDMFWLAQELPLKNALTPAQNLEFLGGIYGFKPDIPAALTLTGLSDLADCPTHYLSSGQKRRLILSLLSQTQRKIWLLDEPTNHLDAQGITLLQTLLQSHSQSGGISIIATHTPEHFKGAKNLDLSQFASNRNETKEAKS